MVFGFFSRKAQVDSEQLRTPSPNGERDKAIPSLSPPATPSPPPEPSTSVVATTKDDLLTLISSIPPQTLHTYTITHLASTTPDSLTVTAFFSALSPPPKLHCARCHKNYFDVENSDRSCLVPHDDESAVVERVNRGGYETLYGCCGRTVEGDGDMGPPDGYCYEGKHTTDIKRARFRADSTIHEDKLTSCDAMRCFSPSCPPSESSESGSSRRKRKRTVQKHEDEDATVVNDETGSVGKTRAPRKKRAKTKRDDKPFKPSLASEEEDDMDLDDVSKSRRKPRRKVPFPASPSSSPILRPLRSSMSPTRSTSKGRNVSFSSASAVVKTT